jgi:hypothetical protein
MAALNLVATPLEAGIRYSRHQSDNLSPEEQLFMQNVPYQQAISNL